MTSGATPDLYESLGALAQQPVSASASGTYETKSVETIDEEGLRLIGHVEL